MKKTNTTEYSFKCFAIAFLLLISFNIKAQQNNIGQLWKCNTVPSESLRSLSVITETTVDTSPCWRTFAMCA